MCPTHRCYGTLDATGWSDKPSRAVSASTSRFISSNSKHIRQLTEDLGDATVLLRSTPRVTSRVDLSVNDVISETYLKGPTALTPKMNSIDCAASTRARATWTCTCFSISQKPRNRLTGPNCIPSLSRSFPLPSLLCFHSLRASLMILPAQKAKVSHPAPPP